MVPTSLAAEMPTLHMICGKIAAGKSTLADAPATILISEDVWLAALYRDEQRAVAEYARNARRLREVMGGHVEALLRAGLSVVLDFPANTVANRQWMRGLFEKAGAAGCTFSTCRTRSARRACGSATPPAPISSR